MAVADSPFALLLLTVAVLVYGIISLVPRVDNRIPDGYRKFVALTTLGISYLVVLAFLVFSIETVTNVEQMEQVLWLAVLAFSLFGLTLLYEVFDDWLRLFADPEYNTWVEASLVVAAVVLLVVFLLLVQ